MLSDWNKFVQQVYRAGKAKNPAFKFGDALKEASTRKHEMKGGNAESSAANTAAPFKGGKSNKGGKSKKAGKKNKGTRKNKCK